MGVADEADVGVEAGIEVDEVAAPVFARGVDVSVMMEGGSFTRIDCLLSSC